MRMQPGPRHEHDDPATVRAAAHDRMPQLPDFMSGIGLLGRDWSCAGDLPPRLDSMQNDRLKPTPIKHPR
jgi:hypothetical protein